MSLARHNIVVMGLDPKVVPQVKMGVRDAIQIVLPSFVGLSSCRRQEPCRLLVDREASLSDRNSSFILDLS